MVTTPKTQRGQREIPLQPQTKALLETTPIEERHGYIYHTANGTPVEPKHYRDRVFCKRRSNNVPQGWWKRPMRAVEKCTTQSLHLRALMNALREGGRDVQSGVIRSDSQGLPRRGDEHP